MSNKTEWIEFVFCPAYDTKPAISCSQLRGNYDLESITIAGLKV